jgi:hypothetical protein
MLLECTKADSRKYPGADPFQRSATLSRSAPQLSKEAKNMTKLRHLIPLAAVLAMLALAPVAMAGDASLAGYSTPAGSVQVNVAGAQEQPSGNVSAPSGAPQKTVVTNKGSSLPFTGLDLSLVVGAGVLLLGLGFGMRRLVGRPAAS